MADTTGSKLDTRWLGALATGALCLMYLLIWWNRYLPLTAEGELTVGRMVSAGLMPYRDFYYPLPPLPLAVLSLVFKVFGLKLIAVYAVGVALRTIGAVLLYLWLARLFRPSSVFVGTAVAFVLSCSDIVDTPPHYTHMVTFLAVLAGFLLDGAIVSKSRLRYVLFAFGGGLALGLNCLQKQTSGPLVAVLALTLLGVNAIRTRGRQVYRDLWPPALGVVLPIGATVLWLLHSHLFGPFLSQAFMAGAGAKGGALAIFFRPLLTTEKVPWLLASALFGVGVAAVYCLIWNLPPHFRQQETDSENLGVSLAVVGAIMSVLIGMALTWPAVNGRTLSLAATYVTLILTSLIALWFVPRLFKEELRDKDFRILLAAVIASGTAYGLSLSWPAFEGMIFPGLALVLAMAFDRPAPFPHQRATRQVLFTLCFLAIAWSSYRKITYPFAWNYWTEPPIWESNQQSRAQSLEGFQLSPGTAEFVDRVVSLVQRYTRPDDKILVFPHMTQLYGLCDRLPATFAPMHWFDVCPDSLAESDAALIENKPPAAIVRMLLPARAFLFNEALFRNGRPSGQRRMAAAIEDLTKKYVLADRIESSNSAMPIEIWIRPDRAHPAGKEPSK